MNYYELLGVNNNAAKEEIKIAYKKEIKKWHPDINKDKKAIDMTLKLNEAKDILLDDIKRKEYDNYLKQLDINNYQKYTNVNNDYNTRHNKYEEKMVTKWQYFKEYISNKNIKIYKKIISTILVLLESLLCFILKYFIILLTYICYILSEVIRSFYYYFYPLIIIFLLYIIYECYINGININRVVSIILILLSYFFSFILIKIGNTLISEKVFNFLYNKLDVYLFKKAVFYE